MKINRDRFCRRQVGLRFAGRLYWLLGQIFLNRRLVRSKIRRLSCRKDSISCLVKRGGPDKLFGFRIGEESGVASVETDFFEKFTEFIMAVFPFQFNPYLIILCEKGVRL